LFLDSIARAVPPFEKIKKIYIPSGTAAKSGADLRAAGWVTLAGLSVEEDSATSARQQGCTHILVDGEPVALSDNQKIRTRQ
ncbi:MAG: ATP phosphoribosyltransferase regulatory subunit, partial [Pseudomonadota bacterium]|nr:ATP phosphoribosyltransferase regulatory subunit [Pseudomonadota bacterium]